LERRVKLPKIVQITWKVGRRGIESRNDGLLIRLLDVANLCFGKLGLEGRRDVTKSRTRLLWPKGFTICA